MPFMQDPREFVEEVLYFQEHGLKSFAIEFVEMYSIPRRPEHTYRAITYLNIQCRDLSSRGFQRTSPVMITPLEQIAISPP